MKSLPYYYWHVLLCGDQFATAWVSCGCLAALALRSKWALMARFTIMLGVAIAIEVGTKGAFYGWGIDFGIDSFHGMSGHTLRSFAVYPTFGFVVFSGSSHLREMIGVAVGSLIALCVMLAIILLRSHTPVEAVTGALFGLILPAVFVKTQRLSPLRASHQFAVILVVVLLCMEAPHSRFDFENVIAQSARGLRHWSSAQPCRKRGGEVACEHGPVASPE